MSVSPGTGAITNCVQTPSSDQMQRGGTLTATCVLQRSNFLEYGVELEVAAPTASTGSAAGWQVMVSAGSASSGWVSGPARVQVSYFADTITFTYSLRAPANAVVSGATISTTVTAYSCQLVFCRINRGATTLSGKIAPLGAGDTSLTCTPASPLSVERNGSATVTCRVNGLSGLGSTSLIVRSVTIPAPPSGWTMTTSPAGVTGAGGATVISPAQTLAANSSWSFTITLSPSCTAAATGNWQITSQVANTNGQQTGPNVAGPSTAYQATAGDTASTTTLTVVSGPIDWSLTYAFEEQTVTGSLTYRIVTGGCSAWSVNIQGLPFTYSGSTGGAVIPADNLRLTTVGAPTLVAGAGGEVSAVPSTGGLGTPRQVVSAQAGSGGTYEQTVGLSLTLPAGARVGAYHTTIIVTAVAAPS